MFRYKRKGVNFFRIIRTEKKVVPVVNQTQGEDMLSLYFWVCRSRWKLNIM